ncbi:MAG: hypothetical protein GYB33_02050 [Gammaproteobacteria bacterium]|nr:hypothetical protein [Gammaproteobacteria bacterium]
MKSHPNSPAPIYDSFAELFERGFTIDWVTTSFIGFTHLVCLLGTPLAYYFAPPGFWQVMLSWTLGHMFFGCLSTTLYSHRLISHGAARVVRWPVHLLFGFIGQPMAAQGSVRRWAALHVIHHSVDRTGRHELDPYSATWFSSSWRNFLWSHVLTYLLFHPDTSEKDKAYEAKNSAPLVWQDKLYVPLLVGLNFILPLGLGIWLSGTLVGGLCLMTASICAFVLGQHNTWTVNSVTHMWGFIRGASSSAKNNYLWLGPLGEGNHHADHHDFARDYRNGFGLSGWLLDPTRYVILLLNGLGLVKGLHRASKKQEAEIIARRKLLQVRGRLQGALWEAWETRLETLKSDWLEATHQWEAFKAQRLQLRAMHLPQLELEKKLNALKAEVAIARRTMRARKQAFLDALYELRVTHQYA